MSYAAGAALQSALYTALVGSSAVTDLVGDAIFDAPPAGVVPPLYISLGVDAARDASTKDSTGSRHNCTLSVVATEEGFATAKTVATAICDTLLGADLTLSRGQLIYLKFDRARAAREGSTQLRRIDLRFRALIDNI